MFIGMTPETYYWAMGFKSNIDQNCIGYYLHSTAFNHEALGIISNTVLINIAFKTHGPVNVSLVIPMNIEIPP